MKKFLRVALLLGLVGVLVLFEIRWVSEKNYENQKSRTAELLSELAGEVSIIEVGLIDGGEITESKEKFGTALSELRDIPYAVNEKGDILAELSAYDESLDNNAEIASELKVLRLLCAGFAEKMSTEYKDQPVNSDLFRKMNKDFLELIDNLPEVKYEPVQKLVAELKDVLNQVAVSAAATANCVGVCAKTTVETQRAALEKKIDVATKKIEEVNDAIRKEFDSSELVLHLNKI